MYKAILDIFLDIMEMNNTLRTKQSCKDVCRNILFNIKTVMACQ